MEFCVAKFVEENENNVYMALAGWVEGVGPESMLAKSVSEAIDKKVIVSCLWPKAWAQIRLPGKDMMLKKKDLELEKDVWENDAQILFTSDDYEAAEAFFLSQPGCKKTNERKRNRIPTEKAVGNREETTQRVQKKKRQGTKVSSNETASAVSSSHTSKGSSPTKKSQTDAPPQAKKRRSIDPSSAKNSHEKTKTIPDGETSIPALQVRKATLTDTATPLKGTVRKSATTTPSTPTVRKSAGADQDGHNTTEIDDSISNRLRSSEKKVGKRVPDSRIYNLRSSEKKNKGPSLTTRSNLKDQQRNNRADLGDVEKARRALLIDDVEEGNNSLEAIHQTIRKGFASVETRLKRIEVAMGLTNDEVEDQVAADGDIKLGMGLTISKKFYRKLSLYTSLSKMATAVSKEVFTETQLIADKAQQFVTKHRLLIGCVKGFLKRTWTKMGNSSNDDYVDKTVEKAITTLIGNTRRLYKNKGEISIDEDVQEGAILPENDSPSVPVRLVPTQPMNSISAAMGPSTSSFPESSVMSRPSLYLPHHAPQYYQAADHHFYPQQQWHPMQWYPGQEPSQN